MKPEIVKKLRKFVRALLQQNRNYGREFEQQVRMIQARDAKIKSLERQLAPFGHVTVEREPWIDPNIRTLTIRFDMRWAEQSKGAVFERILDQVRSSIIRDLKL